MIIDSAIEEQEWLFALDYMEGGVVKTWRWTTADEAIPITGDGTYLPRGPVQGFGGFEDETGRINAKHWFIVLFDPDRVYNDHYARRWRRRICRMSVVTKPGPVVKPIRTGWLAQRGWMLGDQGPTLRLSFSGILSRAQGTNKRLMNDKAQIRATGDPNEDSLRYAQRKIDANWGGN